MFHAEPRSCGRAPGGRMSLRVIQWATGNASRPALRAIIPHPELELVRVHAHADQKVADESAAEGGGAPAPHPVSDRGGGGAAGAVRVHPRSDRPTARTDPGPMLMGAGCGDHDAGQGRRAPNRRRATGASLPEPPRPARGSVARTDFPRAKGKTLDPASRTALFVSQGTLGCRPSGKYRCR
jgi:hypothetical protein